MNQNHLPAVHEGRGNESGAPPLTAEDLARIARAASWEVVEPLVANLHGVRSALNPARGGYVAVRMEAAIGLLEALSREDLPRLLAALRAQRVAPVDREAGTCPDCGSEDVDSYDHGHGNRCSAVKCFYCGFRGPARATEAEAWAAWDALVSPAPPAVDREAEERCPDCGRRDPDITVEPDGSYTCDHCGHFTPAVTPADRKTAIRAVRDVLDEHAGQRVGRNALAAEIVDRVAPLLQGAQPGEAEQSAEPVSTVRYMSEVFRIVSGALQGDEAKVRAYTAFLADRLEEAGERSTGGRLRKLLDGGGNVVRPATSSGRVGLAFTNRSVPDPDAIFGPARHCGWCGGQSHLRLRGCPLCGTPWPVEPDAALSAPRGEAHQEASSADAERCRVCGTALPREEVGTYRTCEACWWERPATPTEEVKP